MGRASSARTLARLPRIIECGGSEEREETGLGYLVNFQPDSRRAKPRPPGRHRRISLPPREVGGAAGHRRPLEIALVGSSARDAAPPLALCIADIPLQEKYVMAPKRFRLELDEITFWWIGLEDIHDAFDPLRRGDAARRVILFDA